MFGRHTLEDILSFIKVAIIFGIIAAFLVPGQAKGSEHPPDLLQAAGCLSEEVALDVSRVWEKKGEYWSNEKFFEYILAGKCFQLFEGYPTYVVRTVKRLGKRYNGYVAYVVEARFLGAAPGKKFYFFFYGTLPAAAIDTEI